MTALDTEALTMALRDLLPHWPASGEVIWEPLPSSRPVFRLISLEDSSRVVGKFFHSYPPKSTDDCSLAWEYDNYLWAEQFGLFGNHGSKLIPRLLGCCPEIRLGLLLEDIPGPDLDQLLAEACEQGDCESIHRHLDNLAELLAFFHSRPLPSSLISPRPALGYLDKLRGQLRGMGLLSREEDEALDEEGLAWELLLHELPDRQVLVHGDATPTNFLFPDGRAVALDLERLRLADRLWDLSWVAGEMKHAWIWRGGAPAQAEACIAHFFAAYFYAIQAPQDLIERIYRLNPWYMALAELRIARNDYLSWDCRRALIDEARRCLYFGRRL